MFLPIEIQSKERIEMKVKTIFAGVGGGLLSFGIGVLLHLMKPDVSLTDSLMISLSLGVGLVILALVASTD